MERAFQVDLRGVVDLLSRHLYTSPQVYVRELLQNAVDAVAARRLLDPAAPGAVAIESGPDGTLNVHDTGVGLTEDEVHQFLATIGRSSKRDDLGFARQEFLGQFGIGLLACFLVADEVRVFSQSARGGPSVLWTGFHNGSYTVSLAPTPRAQPGTTVTLLPRPGAEHWLDIASVSELASRYGSLLPVSVSVAGRSVTVGQLPWQPDNPDGQMRRAALARYCEQVYGFLPLDCIDLHVPAAGLTGVAFVLPMPANPAARVGHRVYLRRMLLSENADQLLPEWAFFVRCVVDAAELRPTASREELYQDDLLEETRTALGRQLRDWMLTLAATQPDRLRQFLSVHHLGVKALAVHDSAMLELADRWLPVESNLGAMTLFQLRQRSRALRYTVTDGEFRELAAISAAQGLVVVNGGYTYDLEILQRLPRLDREVDVRRLDPAELTTRFRDPDPELRARVDALVAAAEQCLAATGCRVTVRAFEPHTLPAVYLVDRDQIAAAEMRSARERADDVWAGVLSAFDQPGHSRGPQLVLNATNPVVRRTCDTANPQLAGLAVQALYGQALLAGRHPMTAVDSAMLNQSLLGLLDRAIGPGA